jgi:hypothetical protein
LQQENRGSSIQLQEDFESKQNLAITWAALLQSLEQWLNWPSQLHPHLVCTLHRLMPLCSKFVTTIYNIGWPLLILIRFYIISSHTNSQL